MKIRSILSLAFLFFQHFTGVALAATPVLYIVSSDQHSHYENLENFIRSTRVQSDAFMAKHADGKVIYLFNGDFSGVSEWTKNDNGQVGYDALKLLARERTIIMGWGNHEGFDFGGEAGNQLFLSQTKEILAAISQHENQPAHLVGANFDLTPIGESIIRPYQDVFLPDGFEQRFIGGMFDGFYRKTSYSRGAETQILGEQIPLLDYLKVQVSAAAQAGIFTVNLMIHEDHDQLANTLTDLKAWMATKPELAKVKMPLVFAAHSHKVSQLQVGDTWIINSGSLWQYTAVALDQDGKVDKINFMSTADQERLGENAKLSINEWAAIEKARQQIKLISNTAKNTSHIKITRYPEIKLDFKERRTELGTIISEALAIYGEKDSAVTAPDSATPVFGFLNSSVYRREAPLNGEINEHDILSMFPFVDMHVKIFEMNGATVQKLFTAARKNRIENSPDHQGYSPQISSNLRERENFELEEFSGGKWKPLDAQKNYRLVLDHWLGINGPKIPEVDEIFKNEVKMIGVETPASESAIFTKYGATAIEASCRNEMH